MTLNDRSTPVAPIVTDEMVKAACLAFGRSYDPQLTAAMRHALAAALKFQQNPASGGIR